ncbi:CCDC174 family protein [bacterium]|nr:CCDC174 family protein [bacterium]
MNKAASTKPKSYLPLILCGASALVVIGVAIALPVQLWAKVSLCAAALMSVAGILISNRTPSKTADNPALTPVTTPDDTPAAQLAELKALREQTQNEFADREQRLQQRERKLGENWLRHQEWFEYPDPLCQSADRDFNPKLSEQDRQVLDILEAESKSVYEKILANGYVKDGQADVPEIRDDVLTLVTKIARIYSPEHDNPLLETSIEQLIRALGRTCLHLLVVLEKLPLDVKSYNINSAYGYIQKAVSSYGTYKSAEPWLAYIARTVYVGRFVAGANPVSLGAWWAATELGKRGAAKVVKNVIDEQAIGFLHDLIRVVGFEVAGIYSGEFRHRDPNWIYGTELTDLLHHFPTSRENLAEAMQHVAGLQLRNEYDRIYLYRCLASRKSAVPKLVEPSQLDREDRQKIVERVEHFFSNHVHGQTEDKVNRWRDEFETRFDTRLKLSDSANSQVQATEVTAALNALATFQSVICQADKDTVEDAVCKSNTYKQLAEELRSAFKVQRQETFEAPDLEPQSPIADALINDIVTSVVRFTPTIETAATDKLIDAEVAEVMAVSVGHYYRVPKTEMDALLDAEYERVVQSALPEAVSRPRINPSLDRAIVVRLHEFNEDVLFIYSDAKLQSPAGPTSTGVLVGLGSKQNGTVSLLLLNEDSPGNPLWQSEKPATATRIRRMLSDDCQLVTADGATLKIDGSLRGGRFQTYFGPLLAHVRFDSTNPN